MIEQTNTPPVTQPAKPINRKTPKARKLSKPRVIDPGIAAIHAEAKQKVAEYRKTSASGRLLKTILEKRLAQLTVDDRQKLFDTLSGEFTPKLV